MQENRFTFLTFKGNKLKQISDQINKIIETVNEVDIIFKENFEKALEEYEMQNFEALDMYCANNTFAYYMGHPSDDSPENREIYYLKLKKYIQRHLCEI